MPWSLLAAVGSVESQHGTDPGALIPHDRGVLGPMQFQAGSNVLAQKQDSLRRPGLRRHMGALPHLLGPPAVPHGRSRRRDRRGGRQAQARRRPDARLDAGAVPLQRARRLRLARAEAGPQYRSGSCTLGSSDTSGERRHRARRRRRPRTGSGTTTTTTTPIARSPDVTAADLLSSTAIAARRAGREATCAPASSTRGSCSCSAGSPRRTRS